MLRSCLHQEYIFQVPKPSAALQGRIGTIPTRDTESQAGIAMALNEDISEDEFCKQNLLSLHISYVGSRFFRFWCIETYQFHWEVKKTEIQKDVGPKLGSHSLFTHPSSFGAPRLYLGMCSVLKVQRMNKGWMVPAWGEVVVKSRRWTLISNHAGNINSQPSWELWKEGYGS